MDIIPYSVKQHNTDNLLLLLIEVFYPYNTAKMKEKLWRISPKAVDRSATDGVAGSVSMNSL